MFSATAATPTGHTFGPTKCTACTSSSEWNDAQLTFKIDPFAITLVVHGPETLHIRYSLRSEEALIWWNQRLIEHERRNLKPVYVELRSQRFKETCSYPHTDVMKDTEDCVVDNDALFRDAELSLLSANGGCILFLRQKYYAFTEVFVPRHAWFDTEALFPVRENKFLPVSVVFRMVKNAPDAVLAGRCIQAVPNDPAGIDFTPEAQAAWQQHPFEFFEDPQDANGRPLVRAWQSGYRAYLQKGQYSVKASLRVCTTYSGLVLALERTNGALERITFAVSEKQRLQAEGLTARAYAVLVKYVPTEKTHEGSHLSVDGDVVTLTYGSTIELIELPAKSGLAGVLAGSPSSVSCTLEQRKPTSSDVWRVRRWNIKQWLIYIGAVEFCILCLLLIFVLFLLFVVLPSLFHLLKRML